MEDPLYRRIRMHASKRLKFAEDASYTDRLAQLKEYMRLENEMLQRYHAKGDSGVRVTHSRSIVIDVLMESLFARAVQTYQSQHGKLPCAVALLALGGYGRQELCPFSDIDLMFLYPQKNRGGKGSELAKLQEVMTNEILYPLWDLGLKIGHSSRTINEVIEESRGDIVSKNSMLEARLLSGDKKLFSRFEHLFEKHYLKDDPEVYLETRLDEQRKRRAEIGDTPFLQEPDIKNGVGGLRDYQNILWMAKIRLNVSNLQDLVKKKFLRETDARDLEKAYDYLLRVRNELHFQSKRPSDTLNLEKQPAIAHALGFRQANIFERVEAFMRKYYQNTNAIWFASKILERQLATTGMPGNRTYSMRAAIESRRMMPSHYVDGFRVQNQEFTAISPDVFTQDPTRLVRLFRHMQQLKGELSLELLTLIRDHVHLLTPQVARSESVCRSFRSILQTPGEVYPVLKTMHEMGILNRVIPEFEKLTCLVQHELYHRYTADIHTLSTIRELDAIFTAETPEHASYLKELRRTEHPTLLYTILLLHDIGKGVAIENHAQIGEEMAKPILERLGISAPLQKTILFIIRNHLEMARFWQRFDVEDPQTIESFASIIQNDEFLRYLYVLTPCDTRGTASELWNSYKQSLHRQLYLGTARHLDGGISKEEQRENSRMIQEKILEKELPNISEEEIDAHFNLLPERYFLLNGQADIELHIRMIHDLLDNISRADSIGSLIPVIEWVDDVDQSMSVVNVVTWDRSGLFYKLAGAFAVAGLNILSTKAISRSDHITIDTFYVTEPGGGVVQNTKAREAFEKSIEEALTHNKDLTPEIQEQARKNAKPSYTKTTTRLKAPIAQSVDVYHELSLNRTIVEIQANDHIGLLYDLSREIFQHGYDITFARIATERDVAMDTFYIEPISGNEEAESTGALVDLRQSLSDIISNGSDKQAFA